MKFLIGVVVGVAIAPAVRTIGMTKFASRKTEQAFIKLVDYLNSKDGVSATYTPRDEE